MRSGSLTNSGCGRGLCCRSAEPSGERVQDAGSHWNICSVLRASHRPGAGRGGRSSSYFPTEWEPVLSLIQRLRGSWVQGVTGDWDGSPGV